MYSFVHEFICSETILLKMYFVPGIVPGAGATPMKKTQGECLGVNRWADSYYVIFRDLWQVPLTVLFKVPAVNDDLQPQSSW